MGRKHQCFKPITVQETKFSGYAAMLRPSHSAYVAVCCIAFYLFLINGYAHLYPNPQENHAIQEVSQSFILFLQQ